jgi:hypothetical protein
MPASLVVRGYVTREKCIRVEFVYRWTARVCSRGSERHEEEEMRSGVRPLTLASIFIATSLAAGCRHETVVITPPPSTEETSNIATTGQILINGPSKTGEGTEKSRSMIRFRNRLDRTVSIDILNHRHVEMSIGDSRSDSVQLHSGSHSVSISAPGMKAAKFNVSLDSEGVYTIEIYRRSSRD